MNASSRRVGMEMTSNSPELAQPGWADPSVPPPTSGRKRWRLWEIHRGIHGALLALSFTPDELQGLVRRAGIETSAEARYYDIHRHLCEACTSQGRLSELIERALDQKFATKILMLRGVRSGEVLEQRWHEAWSRGRGLPALFWSYLAHPSSTEEIRAGFYADVHALFFNALSEREKLLEKVDDLEHRCRALEKRRREDVSALQERLDRERKRSAEAQVERASFTKDSIALRRRAEVAAQKAALAEARVRTLEDRLRDARASIPAFPRPPQVVIADPEAPAPKQVAAAPYRSNVTVITRIPGVRIGYVGGRPGPIERIREFCEKRGAAFIYHDGGLEDSPVRLDELLARADVVFYPVDCVSHEATLHLRALCRRLDKPSIPLRNASISAFRRAIKSWCGLT